MKPLTEQHLAIYRRQMVEVVDIHFDLASDEIGKGALDAGLRRALLEVPRHLFVRWLRQAFRPSRSRRRLSRQSHGRREDRRFQRPT